LTLIDPDIQFQQGRRLVLLHSETNLCTLDGLLLSARSSNAKANKAVEINSNK